MSRLALRMRPDLLAQREPSGGAWLVHDPLGLRYFQLRDEEWAVLRLLDGQCTVADLRQQFEAQFAPLQLSAGELQQFLHRLHELGLVQADAPGQGDVLARRAAEAQARNFWARLANPLAIPLGSVAAAGWSPALSRLARVALSPGLLLVAGALVLAAAVTGLVHGTGPAARLPAAETFFALEQGGWFVLAVVVVKCLHELGHALVLARCGGTLHGVGMMLLCFSPALYCDLSDAWRLSRAKRMAVAAAGMAVELVLASVAWLFVQVAAPGAAQSLALRVLLVCTVGTLLFNGNPLVRGDGYYLLSDWLGVPNLAQEGRAALARLAGAWLLGWESQAPGAAPGEPDAATPDGASLRTLLLALYGLLSLVYGWALVLGVVWFVGLVLQPYGLTPVAAVLGAVMIGGSAAPGAARLWRALGRPGGMPRLRRGRAALSLLVLAGLLVGVAYLPAPYRVAVRVWLEAEEAQQAYVTLPGFVAWQVAPETRVQPGDPLLRLRNPEFEESLRDLSAEVVSLEQKLAHARVLATGDPGAAATLPTTQQALAEAEQRLAQAEQERERLTLRAARAGEVLEPASPARAAPRAGDAARLASWEGSPLAPRNLGAWLLPGVLACQVAEPSEVVALALVDQRELPFVRVGQPVRLWIEQGPVRVLTGRVVELARADPEQLPAEQLLALHMAGEPGAARAAPSGSPGPPGVAGGAAVWHQARIVLDQAALGEWERRTLRPGMVGQARIAGDWQPLGAWLWRGVRRTFLWSPTE